MPLINVPLSGGFYSDEAKNLAVEEAINLYPAIVQTQSPSNPDALRAPAGLTTFSEDGGEGACRGAVRLENKLYTVHGNRFYKVDENGIKTAVGDTVEGTGLVVMVENGVTITVVVPGSAVGYFYKLVSDSFFEITDQVYLDYGEKIDVTYKDGYFVYVTAKEFFISSLVTEDDGTSFDGLDFSTAEISTDDNVACDTIRNELYIFGQNSIEVFQNTGTDFPFQRIPGAAIDRGLVSTFSTIPFQNRYLFIGAGKNEGVSIWAGAPGNSERLSTPAIDNILQSVPRDDLFNAFSFRYSESGNYFCGFTIPNQLTLVYDETTSAAVGRPIWHKRTSDLAGEGTWRPSHILQVYGEILCCDTIDGRIGKIDLETFTEYGSNVLRRFNTIYVANSGDRFRIVLADLETQIGITGFTSSPPVVAPPQVIMRTSEDGGVDFVGALTRELPTNPSGRTRSVWYQLGQYEYSLAFQFDFQTSEKLAITKLSVVIE